MARVVTLKDKVRAIKRRYKFVTSKRFLYNKKAELRRKYVRVRIWWLIHDPDRGYSIFPMEFKRAARRLTVEQWATLIKDGLHLPSRPPTPDFLEPIITIFKQAVLPAINNKGGSKWRFISLMAWTGADDIRQGKHSAARPARHKTTKKRAANERNRRRRRH